MMLDVSCELDRHTPRSRLADADDAGSRKEACKTGKGFVPSAPPL